MPDFHSITPGLLKIEAAMELAADSITCRLDERANYRPYFYVKGHNGVPAELRHGSWDLGDMTGRYLESMIMSRRMMGRRENWSLAEQRLTEFLLSLFGPDDLVQDIDKNAPDHMFAQGSALYGLTALFQDTGSERIKTRIEQFISGLLRHAVPRGDHVYYPECATEAPCSHMAGYQIFPAMRFYEMTGYEPAMELSTKLSKWAFHHDDTLAEDGKLTRIGWDGHIHAWVDTLCGVMRCARAGGGPDLKTAVARCKANYDWIRGNYATSFGWVPDFPTSPTSETCAISSLMRMALELIHEGYDEYWNDIERFTRNQLVENQFRDLSRKNIVDKRVEAALTGAFDCWAKPNTLFASVRMWGKEDDGDVEGCCVNGGMRGLFMAWGNAVTAGDGTTNVNLLIDRETDAVRVTDELHSAGRITITAKKQITPALRMPEWTTGDVKVEGAAEFLFSGNRVEIRDMPVDRPVSVSFPQRRIRERITLADVDYEIDWVGDTVVSVSPEGGNYPIYRRR